jgi:endonuclease VIII
MPEGHTIHRLALDLNRDFMGHAIKASSPQGRFTDHGVIDGMQLKEAHAIGKHLFLEFKTSDREARVHIHLGLFGKFKKQPLAGRDPGPSVRLRIQHDVHCWDLAGPTACEVLDDVKFEALQDRLGADPLSAAPRSPRTWHKVHASKRSIGALLLDQSVFAGIGNVYRAELLFLIGVHPEASGNAIDKTQFEKLWKLARELLKRGVKANRIVTVDGADRRTRKKEALYVYKQKHCRICSVPIARSTNATRTIYHCPSCQPLPSSVKEAQKASRARRKES